MKKRALSLLLVVLMALALIPTVSAAGDYKITIKDETAGYTYVAYQIFTGDLSGSTLSNIAWGTGITADGQTALGSAASLAETMNDVTNDSDEAKAFADKLAQYLTNGVTLTYDATNKNYSVSGLAAGYYLVKNTDIPETTDTASYAYTDYILQVVNNVEVSPKSSVPTVEKKIVLSDNTKVDANSASIGDTIKYEITGKLPSTIDTYNTYFYEFTDTLSKGLTYNNDLTVKVGSTDVTSYFYKNATVDESTKITTINVTIADILALNNLDNFSDVTKDSEVVITYSATLNENANIGTANDNSVVLTYSNDPNNSGTKATGTPATPAEKPTTTNPTGVTPKDTVSTYTTGITITKVDGTTKNILTGAKFKLTGTSVKTVIVNGTKVETSDSVVAEAEVDSNGKLTFNGLGAGTYTITETAPPAGYNTCADVQFTVSFNDNNDKKFSVASIEGGTTVDIDDKTNTLTTTIENKAGTILPTTGGIGTTIFYVIGGLLAVGAIIFFVTKRRMSEKN